MQANEQPSSSEAAFAPVVYAYTRANAIDDGVLIDISEVAKEAGISVHTAVTDSVWNQYIKWTDDDSNRQTHQDQSGRLWDVTWMARMGMLQAKREQQVLFPMYCVPRDGHSTEASEISLKAHIGPGDQGEPVVTIMLPNED